MKWTQTKVSNPAALQIDMLSNYLDDIGLFFNLCGNLFPSIRKCHENIYKKGG